MKMHHLFLLTSILFIFSAGNTNAQDQTSYYDDFSNEHTIFVELGGQGLIMSFNYDVRFSEKTKGLGARAGIGYVGLGNDFASFLCFPLALNYLLNKDDSKHHFEIGIGTTVFRGDFLDETTDYRAVGTMNFGYRLQPSDGGFSFRVGFTPLFKFRDSDLNSEGPFFVPYFAGISFGYTIPQ